MSFKYETHLHTQEASKCARQPAADYVQYYIDQGYTGIFVTDHFTGYCPAPDPSLPWPEWVDAYCLGWEKAKNEGDKRGLDVFFGWEQTMDTDEYLVYGLDKAWLLAHPECRHWTRREMFETVSALGGCVVQAHPFRERGYVPFDRIYPSFCHGVEIANCGNEAYMDVIARRYAEIFGKPMLSGSDIHGIDPAAAPYGVELEERLTCAGDYARLIRSGFQPKLILPEGRTIEPCGAVPKLDAVLYDAQEQPIPFPDGILVPHS